jgi:hypothetical protein
VHLHIKTDDLASGIVAFVPIWRSVVEETLDEEDVVESISVHIELISKIVLESLRCTQSCMTDCARGGALGEDTYRFGTYY